MNLIKHVNNTFWTVVLKKTLDSPLDSKEIKPVNPKGNQPWIFIRRTDAEAEAPVLWPHDAKSRLLRKDLDVEKDWRQEEKGVIAGVQPRWIQGDSKVGGRSRRLWKNTYLITDIERD